RVDRSGQPRPRARSAAGGASCRRRTHPPAGRDRGGGAAAAGERARIRAGPRPARRRGAARVRGRRRRTLARAGVAAPRLDRRRRLRSLPCVGGSGRTRAPPLPPDRVPVVDVHCPHRGGLRAMAGAHDDAAAQLVRARAVYEELDRPEALLLTCEPLEADAALLAGDAERACALARQNCEGLADRGLWLPYATRAAFLGELLLTGGDEAAAARWADESRARAVEDDVWSQIAWRALQARIDGDAKLAGEALALARETDLVELEARAWLASGDVAAAIRTYERKENVAAAARAAATSA